MKPIKLLLILLFAQSACNNTPEQQKEARSGFFGKGPVYDSLIGISGPEPQTDFIIKTNLPGYMRTGFYYLSDSANGIAKIQEHTGERYFISKEPFAAVDNIETSEIIPESYNGRSYSNLRIKFDEKGTKDLAAGTGEFLSHQQIAVVIGNKLIYVVSNESKTTTGVMNIHLVDYSDTEVNMLKKAIEEKR